MTILITGGSGFIGSVLVSQLNKLNKDNIIIVDNFDNTPDKWKNLNGLKFIDIIDKSKPLKNFYKLHEKYHISNIVHLGACSTTTNHDVQYLMENNYEYSKNLLHSAIINKIPFIYASSASIFGNYNKSHLKQLNPYAFSKHLFDEYVKKIQSDYINFYKYRKPKIIGLRLYNVYGPNEYHKGDMMSFINHAYRQITEYGHVALFKSNDPNIKDGEQTRDFIYVEDVVNTIIYFIDFNIKNNAIYDIGTGINTTWNHLISLMFKYLNIPKNIKYIDMPQSVKNQYQNYTKSSTDFIDMLKYEYGEEWNSIVPEFKPIEQGLYKYLNYLKENKYYIDEL